MPASPCGRRPLHRLFGTMPDKKCPPAPWQDPARSNTLVLLAVEVLKANGKSLPGLTYSGGPDQLQSFRAAVLQAETMLQTVENRGDELIHAYRIFPCDPRKGSSPRNLSDIHDQFKDAGWEKGMSPNTLGDRVEKILMDLEEETDRRREGFIRFLERHGFEPPADEDINGLVRAVLEDFAIPDVLGDVNQLGSEMAAVIRRMLDRAMEPLLLESGTSESPTDPLTISYFMRFVCGHDTWADAKRAKTGGELLIRPYELFLYAHQKDLLSDKLTKLRKDLSEDFIPQPEDSSSLSIMVAHGGAEEALEKWATEDEERARRMEDLEKKTEQRLRLKRLEEEEQRLATERGAKKKSPAKKAAKKKTAKKTARGTAKKKGGRSK
jgi:hypothetical protein